MSKVGASEFNGSRCFEVFTQCITHLVFFVSARTCTEAQCSPGLAMVNFQTKRHPSRVMRIHMAKLITLYT